MSSQAARPILFLDVDGPLIPWGLPPSSLPTYLPMPAEDAHPGLARLNPAHGPRLAALPCDLVWATAWGAGANSLVAPRLGLPPLPVVAFGADYEEDVRIGLHYKTRALVDWAAGRPFAWVDDELTDVDRRWVRAHHPGPALLHRVESSRGLDSPDYAILADWLASR